MIAAPPEGGEPAQHAHQHRRDVIDRRLERDVAHGRQAGEQIDQRREQGQEADQPVGQPVRRHEHEPVREAESGAERPLLEE